VHNTTIVFEISDKRIGKVKTFFDREGAKSLWEEKPGGRCFMEAVEKEFWESASGEVGDLGRLRTKSKGSELP